MSLHDRRKDTSKIVVVYKSKYGSTKKYAYFISEVLLIHKEGCEYLVDLCAKDTLSH
jgi:flavorubredoxin